MKEGANLSDYISVQLGSSFLMNAGICGFIIFLRSNDAVEGEDYIIGDQELQINKDYILNNDIPEMYVDTFVRLFEEETKFHRVLSKKDIIKNYTERLEELSKDEKEKLVGLYKEFEEMMLKNSFKTGYTIAQTYDNINPVTEEMINCLKKEKDFSEKYRLYQQIIDLLKQKKLKNVLIFKELTYTKLKLFFGESEFSLKGNASKSGEAVFDKDFYQPLIVELKAEEKKKNKRCIECMNASADTKPISFMIDTTDDVNRKKSYYWNCKPDAFVCPVCAFIYMFAPVGFAFTGEDSVFVNSNGNINQMCSMMDTYRVKYDIESEKNTGKYKRLYRVFTSGKIDMMQSRLGNFQVIIRSNNYSHFKFSTIDKETVCKLNEGKDYLTKLERKRIKIVDGKYVKDNSDFTKREGKIVTYLFVYDETLDCITGKKSFYPLIDKLMKIELSLDQSINYLKNILELQIIFNGGNEMDELNKKVDSAFMAGRELRKKILGDKADAATEDDNTLRGSVYRLVNLSSVGDTSQFIDTVIRIYSGYGLTIPSVFKDCYKSEEMFKAISHGFILGLKYVKFTKEDTNNG